MGRKRGKRRLTPVSVVDLATAVASCPGFGLQFNDPLQPLQEPPPPLLLSSPCNSPQIVGIHDSGFGSRAGKPFELDLDPLVIAGTGIGNLCCTENTFMSQKSLGNVELAVPIIKTTSDHMTPYSQVNELLQTKDNSALYHNLITEINTLNVKQPISGITSLGLPESAAAVANRTYDVNTENKTPCKQWSSLFSTLPRNAGEYVPRKFDIVEVDGVMIPPTEVIEAGIAFWKDYLVGFFLDSNPLYADVRAHCRRVWRLKGSLNVHYDNSMFYFKFSNPEERQRILESELTFVDGKPFIITTWCPSVDSAREQVLSIPVWAHFSNIPSVLQPLDGINWLANLLGELKCFDANTVARKRLVYAKVLIEIKPDKPLPSKLRVRPSAGQVAIVDVHYSWKLEICGTCHSFGHKEDVCKYDSSSPQQPATVNTIHILQKVPLPRPPVRMWVPKVHQDPDFAKVEHPSSQMPQLIIPTRATTQPLQASMLVHPHPQQVTISPEPQHATIHITSQPLQTTVPSNLQSQQASMPPGPPMFSAPANLHLLGEAAPPPYHRNQIIWIPAEKCWEHIPTEMRYKPDNDIYYKFVSERIGEEKYLFYQVSGKELLLTANDKHGDWNRNILEDESWNRKFLYTPESEVYTPDLARLLSGYVHVVGPVLSDGSSSTASDDSSSDEGS